IVGIEKVVDENAEFTIVFFSERQRMRDRWPQIGVQPVDRGRYAGYGAVGLCRLVSLALALLQIGAQDQRDQLGRIDGQRALYRLFFRSLVFELLAGQRKVDPLLRGRAMGVGDALERPARRLKLSLLKGVLADSGQGSGVDRVDFQNARPEFEGIGIATGLRRLRGLRFEGIDLCQAFSCILHRMHSPSVKSRVPRPAGGMMAPGAPIRNRFTAVYDSHWPWMAVDRRQAGFVRAASARD